MHAHLTLNSCGNETHTNSNKLLFLRIHLSNYLLVFGLSLIQFSKMPSSGTATGSQPVADAGKRGWIYNTI